jgi:hypothetical protein
MKEPRAPNSYQTNTEELTQKINRQDFGEDKPNSSRNKNSWTAQKCRDEAIQKAGSTKVVS